METFKRLDDIMASFDSFDADMRVGTRSRRDKEKQRILAMKATMTGLEAQLEGQVAERCAANARTREWMGQAIAAAQQTMAGQLDDHKARIDRRIDALRARLASMRASFEEDFRAIPLDIEDRGKELADRLTKSMDDFDTESASRLRREHAIILRLAAHESQVARQFDADRTEREHAHVDLVKQLDDHVASRDRRAMLLGAFLNDKIADFENATAEEAKTRLREDTELAAAMSTYVSKLQESLRVVNSDAV